MEKSLKQKIIMKLKKAIGLDYQEWSTNEDEFNDESDGGFEGNQRKRSTWEKFWEMMGIVIDDDYPLFTPKEFFYDGFKSIKSLILKIFLILAICFSTYYLLIIKTWSLSPLVDLVLNSKHEDIYETNLINNEPFMSENNEAYNRLLRLTSFETIYEESLKTVERVSQLIPIELITLLEKNKIQINFINGFINDFFPAESIFTIGIFNPLLKRLMVEIEPTLHETEVFIHEIGHAVDFWGGKSLGFVKERLSSTKQFKKLYLKTRDILVEEEGYGYDEREEYFAQVFQMYIIYPDALNERCSEVYEYMDELVKEVVGRVRNEE